MFMRLIFSSLINHRAPHPPYTYAAALLSKNGEIQGRNLALQVRQTGEQTYTVRLGRGVLRAVAQLTLSPDDGGGTHISGIIGVSPRLLIFLLPPVIVPVGALWNNVESLLPGLIGGVMLGAFILAFSIPFVLIGVHYSKTQLHQALAEIF